MKKIIALLIILIALGELKAQNKQHEFTVEKQDIGVDIVIDEHPIVGYKKELKLTTKDKNKKYRFTFTHGTIEQKEQVLLLNPNKTGEGIVKVYELIEKKYLLVKEVVVDVFEKPMYCFGNICFSTKEEINDIIILTKPFTIKLKNVTKELNYVVQEFKLSWLCNKMVTEVKITGSRIDKTQLGLIDNTCNPIKLYFENIIYEDEKGDLRRSVPLILNYSLPKDELK